MKALKPLPIGIFGLEKIITGNYTYVDKTHHVYNLATYGGGYYFLSRPRRFGKSLFIDTLKQAFLGNKELFKGLYLEHNWDWDVTYPVIHLDFGSSSKVNSQERFFTELKTTLDLCARNYGVILAQNDYGARFGELMRVLYEKYQRRVVVLVDEYDKPILDNLENSAEAAHMRDILKGLYSYIKENDSYLKFVLLTGVSKFSKTSLFSDLNNLKDITLDSRYADLCGYNQSELEANFKEYLDSGQTDLALLRKWYNGYNFAGSDTQKVYNPFDILLFIDNGYKYHNYWFETGTPSFLIKMIEQKSYYFPDLEDIIISPDELSNFDVGNIPITTLLFQSGYLTIKEELNQIDGINYRLSYPNFEVKTSLNRSLLMIGSDLETLSKVRQRLLVILEKSEFERLSEIFTSHFASIPNDWYRNNNIANYEGFYASIIYSYFAALGYDLIAEDITNQGKIDLTIKMPDKILIIEFKLNKYGSVEDAINQIVSKKYPQKYMSLHLPIYLCGMTFDSVERTMVDVKVEKYC